MGLFDYWQENPIIAERERKRREVNSSLFNAMQKEVADRSTVDIENFNSLMEDMATYRLQDR